MSTRLLALDLIEHPINAPVFEHTPSLDFLCAEMRNLDDPVLFLGSKSAVIAGSAVEEPKEFTLMQDCDLFPSENQTIDVPVQNQETMIEDVVNVPNL